MVSSPASQSVSKSEVTGKASLPGVDVSIPDYVAPAPSGQIVSISGSVGSEPSYQNLSIPDSVSKEMSIKQNIIRDK